MAIADGLFRDDLYYRHLDVPDSLASAARPARGHSATGLGDDSPPPGRTGSPHRARTRRGDAGAHALRVARQRPRTRQRDRARHDPHRPGRCSDSTPASRPRAGARFPTSDWTTSSAPICCASSNAVSGASAATATPPRSSACARARCDRASPSWASSDRRGTRHADSTHDMSCASTTCRGFAATLGALERVEVVDLPDFPFHCESRSVHCTCEPSPFTAEGPHDDTAPASPVRLGQIAIGLALALYACAGPAVAAEKPNILFIMGDDIGWMQPSIYHRGLMVGETPNIDRIGHEGAMFTDYYAEQSCTAGRNAFFTGMHPLRAGMIPPQIPGQPVLPAARHAGARQVPARPRLQHRRVRQEPSRRSHRRAADRARLPGVLGLPLPPRRDAGGELPRHQQDADRADRRAALQEHADPRAAGGSRRRRSQDDHVPDAAAPRASCANRPTGRRRTRPARTRAR